MDRWVDLFLYGDAGATSGNPEIMFFIMIMAFVIGQAIGWVYMWTHKVLSYSQTFVGSLVVMPVIVAIMMSLIRDSMSVAFGLLAVFAVVRFRNVLKDTRDTIYILWAIVEGMAVGTGHYTSAMSSVLVLGIVLIYLRYTSFGSRNQFDVVLNLFYVGEQQAGLMDLRPILRRHGARIQLVSTRATPGEGVDFSYRMLLRDPARSGELQAELEQCSGVDRVNMFLRDDESEV